MTCPYCNTELDYTDYYGKWSGRGIDKVGDILHCPNEECDRGFYTDYKGELQEGYPC